MTQVQDYLPFSDPQFSSITLDSHPLKLDETCHRLSFPVKSYTCTALNLDSSSSSSTLTTDSFYVNFGHPWPEWVSFVDGPKARGYFTQNENEDFVVYTDVKLAKLACFSFACHRFDIFKSLSTQDVKEVVEKSCPNLFRKSVNSAKRLRTYVGLDKGDVCGFCDLCGLCDRAYVMFSDSEADARTLELYLLTGFKGRSTYMILSMIGGYYAEIPGHIL